MKINLNFVLFEELSDQSDSSEAEAHIVILRESKDLQPESEAADVRTNGIESRPPHFEATSL